MLNTHHKWSTACLLWLSFYLYACAAPSPIMSHRPQNIGQVTSKDGTRISTVN